MKQTNQNKQQVMGYESIVFVGEDGNLISRALESQLLNSGRFRRVKDGIKITGTVEKYGNDSYTIVGQSVDVTEVSFAFTHTATTWVRIPPPTKFDIIANLVKQVCQTMINQLDRQSENATVTTKYSDAQTAPELEN